jgi:hypothetical protein
MQARRYAGDAPLVVHAFSADGREAGIVRVAHGHERRRMARSYYPIEFGSRSIGDCLDDCYSTVV